jgi:hypothetical protein
LGRVSVDDKAGETLMRALARFFAGGKRAARV